LGGFLSPGERGLERRVCLWQLSKGGVLRFPLRFSKGLSKGGLFGRGTQSGHG